MRLFLLFLALIAIQAHAATPGPRDCARLGIPEGTAVSSLRWERLLTSKEKELREISLCHLGGRRLLVKVAFQNKPNFLLADLRLNLEFPAGRAGEKKGDALRISLANYHTSGEFRAVQLEDEVWISYEGEAGTGSDAARLSFRYCPHPGAPEEASKAPIFSRVILRKIVDAPELPPWPAQQATLILPDSHYRAFNDKVTIQDEREFTGRKLGTAYEARINKGLTRSDIEAIREPFAPKRAKPALQSILPPSPQIPQSPLKPEENTPFAETISFSVKAEDGCRGISLPVSVGIPLPKGRLRGDEPWVLEDASGIPLQAAVALRSKWPDGSAKWLALDFQDTAAGDKRYTLRRAKEGERQVRTSRVFITRTPEAWTVDTGALRVVLNTTAFLPFKTVAVSGQGEEAMREISVPQEGFVLTAGEKRFSSALAQPRRMVLEESTPEKLVIRTEGAYADGKGASFMSYVARMTFRAGSPVVEISFTHVNDALETEFSDISSLQWRFLDAADPELSAMGQEKAFSTKGALFQWDDATAQSGDRSLREQLAGGFIVSAKGRSLGLAFNHFWQRYPKGIMLGRNGATLALLPRLPKPTFGEDLPTHLSFPYLDGDYRLKWGMTFTERFFVDYSGAWPLQALATLAQKPPVAVLPAAWYKKTAVFGIMAAGQQEESARWDTYFDTMFQAHEARRRRQREYGFLNHGDWFGERGRSWGNNEYDTAHAFFMQFVRTGKREYYDAALVAARHQADVDIIHAYPDPFYVGANYIHGIAHTGTTSHRPWHGIWSQDYRRGAWGSNGHTWAEGMTEAWLLAHDRRVAETALELGEHLRWAVAPNFKMNVPNPRYAGWAVRATMALYRTFGDPEYLETARLIAAKTPDHQDAESGGWLYPLYNGPPGNSVYMHGILIAGLAEYHAETGDPGTFEVMRKAGEFVKRSWKKNGYWPYMVIADGSPHPKREEAAPSPGLNFLLADGLAYLGHAAHDPEATAIARAAAHAQLNAPPPKATGQKVGFSLRSGVRLFGYLEEAAQEATSAGQTSRTAPAGTEKKEEGAP